MTCRFSSRPNNTTRLSAEPCFPLTPGGHLVLLNKLAYSAWYLKCLMPSLNFLRGSWKLGKLWRWWGVLKSWNLFSSVKLIKVWHFTFLLYSALSFAISSFLRSRKKYKISRKIPFSLENNIFHKLPNLTVRFSVKIINFCQKYEIRRKIQFEFSLKNSILTQNLTLPCYIIGSYNPRASTGA